jgi:hypothetical protein
VIRRETLYDVAMSKFYEALVGMELFSILADGIKKTQANGT